MDDDDDAVSLTSTIENEDTEEREFSVEKIIGEKVCFDGVRRWLVRWEEYPLKDATWEPFENLDGAPEAMSEWEALKLEIQRHEVKPMVPQWVKEVQDITWAKWRRHLFRNKERKNRGLETTEWPEHPTDMCRNIATQWLSESDIEAASESSDEDLDFTQLDNPTTADSKNKETAEREPGTSAATTSDELNLINEHPPKQKKTEISLGTVAAAGLDSDSPIQSRQPSVPKLQVDKRPHKLSFSQQTLTKSGLNSSAKKPTAPSAAAAAAAGASSSAAPARTQSSTPKTGQTAIRGNSTRSLVNVFAGGKMPNKRATKIGGPGPAQGGKVSSLRYQNMMKKSSRDKENAAPPSIPRSLRPLAPGKPRVAQHKASAATSPAAYDTTTAKVTTPEELDTTLKSQLPRRSSIKPIRSTAESSNTTAGESSQLPNRKKLVRFGETSMKENLSHEPSLFMEDSAHVPQGYTRKRSPPPRSPSPSPSPTPDQRHHEGPFQPIHTANLSKTCSIGAKSTSTINLLFHQVPRPKAAWVDALKSHDPLHFTHACHASDFISQFSGLDSQIVASGYASAPVDHDMFETITDRLKRDSRGMFCHTESFCIIMYPSKSEEWEEAGKLGAQSTNHGPMRYTVYGSACFQRSELPQDRSSAVQDALVGANLNSFLHLEVGRRIYPSAEDSKSDRLQVYLAFPRSAIEQAKLMVLWIKSACKFECAFLGADDAAGDWESFLQCQQGALIIHEEAMKKIRLFPNMFQVLKRSSQGQISVSIFDRALASSISMTMWTMKRPTLGNLGLRKVASTGAVFLLAPSFIVTCPRECRRFLKWFWEQYNSKTVVLRAKLAAPTGIVEWIEDIALNKFTRRECSIGDEEDWSSCINILAVLLRDSPDDDETDSSDILTPLALAPENIDPSDEQSLVNWFGWWTTTVLDKYCSFYVVGSGGANSGKVESTINVKPVRWEKGTGVELNILHRNNQQEYPQQGRPEESPGTNHSSRSLQLVGSDTWMALEDFLKVIFYRLKKSSRPMFLFYRPVGYKDIARFTTYREWFESFFPLSETLRRYPPGSPMLKHTLTGLFYTPDPEPDKPVEDPSLRPERYTPEHHSWIAMFRPCSPSQRPWKQSELYIWDQRYQGKVKSGQKLYESDLLQVHRDFIRQVGQNNNERNPKQVLAKVWLGGWGAWRSSYSNPLDITLDRLNLFAGISAQAEDFGRWVPYREPDILKAGWTMVNPDSFRPQPMQIDKPQLSVDTGDRTAAENAYAEQQDDDEWDREARMLFHAPPKQGAVTYSNTFFLTTTNSGKLGQDGRFAHKYVPTKLWYNAQASQGRGYAHIMIDRWSNIFEELRIPAK